MVAQEGMPQQVSFYSPLWKDTWAVAPMPDAIRNLVPVPEHVVNEPSILETICDFGSIWPVPRSRKAAAAYPIPERFYHDISTHPLRFASTQYTVSARHLNSPTQCVLRRTAIVGAGKGQSTFHEVSTVL